MKNHLFTTNQDVSYKYYCLKGKEDFIDDDELPRVSSDHNEALAAKSVQNKKPKHFNSTNTNYRYYIKIHPSGKAYNPIEYFKIKDTNSNKLINEICKDGWSFKEVNKSIFDKYLRFLTTHSLSWLKEVERDINT